MAFCTLTLHYSTLIYQKKNYTHRRGGITDGGDIVRAIGPGSSGTWLASPLGGRNRGKSAQRALGSPPSCDAALRNSSIPGEDAEEAEAAELPGS